MIGKDYFLRQAKLLLKLAQVTRDRQKAAVFAQKAAELRDRGDRVPVSDARPVRSGRPVNSLG